MIASRGPLEFLFTEERKIFLPLSLSREKKNCRQCRENIRSRTEVVLFADYISLSI
jgi:hypothetical protein